MTAGVTPSLPPGGRRRSVTTTRTSRSCCHPRWTTGCPRTTPLGSLPRWWTRCWSCPRSTTPTSRPLGAPPYHPTMMLKLLLYAVSIGVTSSREMERRCQVDVAFRWLIGQRGSGLPLDLRFGAGTWPLDDLFIQVLTLCAKPGLVRLGRVALDGTKLRASASRHKAMSYDRLGQRIDEIKQAEVTAMLGEAEASGPGRGRGVRRGPTGRRTAQGAGYQGGPFGQAAGGQGSYRGRGQGEGAQRRRPPRWPRQGGDDAAIEHAAEVAAARATPNEASPTQLHRPRVAHDEDRRRSFHYCYNAQTVVDEHAQVMIAAELDQAGY